MRRGFAVLAACLLLVVTVAGSAAAHADARPFKGSVAGEVMFPFVGTEVCPETDVWAGGLRTESFASGNASHLGLVSMTTLHCTPKGDTIAGGVGTFVAANGDEVYYEYGGTAPFPGPGVTVIVAEVEFVITGGTGRFANASGSGHMTAYVQFEGFEDPAWAAAWVWSGTISY